MQQPDVIAVAKRLPAFRMLAGGLAGDRRAAAAMEFALVLPFFLLMMCGTLQYGVLFYTWNVALNGARNAARALAVGSVDEAGAEAMMVAALPPWVTMARPAPSDGDRNCGGGNGDENDTGGYGPGGCGAGNGNGNGTGNGNGNVGNDDGDGAGDAGSGAISAVATDAVVGGDVSATLIFPSALATFLPLAPMPANVRVQVQMVKEA